MNINITTDDFDLHLDIDDTLQAQRAWSVYFSPEESHRVCDWPANQLFSSAKQARAWARLWFPHEDGYNIDRRLSFQVIDHPYNLRRITEETADE